MAVKLIVAPKAEQDIDEAYAWYESHREGWGDVFLTNVDECIQGICTAPEMHPVVFLGYRSSLVRRFPYAVYYEYDADVVTVFSIQRAIPRNGSSGFRSTDATGDD